MPQTEIQPLTIGDVTIEDAWIDFDLHGGPSNHRLAIGISDRLNTLAAVTPIGTHPEIEHHDPESTYWVGYGNGIYRRFKDGKVGVPANTSPKTNTVSVESVDRTEERVPDLTHTTRRAINEERSHTALQALFKGEHLSEYVIDVSLANEVIERYINGPLGSDNVSNTYHERSTAGRPHWQNLQTRHDKETYKQVNDLTINLVLTEYDKWGFFPEESIDLLSARTLIEGQFSQDKYGGLWEPSSLD